MNSEAISSGSQDQWSMSKNVDRDSTLMVVWRVMRPGGPMNLGKKTQQCLYPFHVKICQGRWKELF